MEATSEEKVYYGKVLKRLIDNAPGNNNDKILADGMYDNNNIFRYPFKNH